MPSHVWLVFVAFAFASSMGAQAALLKVGDLAPKLEVSKWMQGEPIKDFQPGKVYIVETWVTWYIPCTNAVAHLDDLHRKFKDKGLVVIGVNARQGMFAGRVSGAPRVDDPHDHEMAVAEFLQEMGSRMSYRIALDDMSSYPEGAVAVNWLKAAEQTDIPTAFVVDKQGRIAWIGKPDALSDTLIEQILTGRYDVAKAAATEELKRRKQAEIKQLTGVVVDNLRDLNWSEAEAALNELERVAPERQTAVQRYRFEVFLGRKQYTAAYKLAGALSDANLTNASLQRDLANIIVARKGLEVRDVALAEKLAMRANEAANGRSPLILETLARAQFMNGKKEEAIESERKAFEHSSEKGRAAIGSKIKSYENGQLPEMGD